MKKDKNKKDEAKIKREKKIKEQGKGREKNMKGKSQKNKRKSELNAMFFIILIAAVLFIISTYAWFSTQKNVSITNLKGTVQVAEGLEISLDAKSWSNSIKLGDGDGEVNIIDNAYAGHHNISPSEMLPVSTLAIPAKDSKGSPIDNYLKMLRGKINDSKKLSEIGFTADEGKDTTGIQSTDKTFPGFFAFDIFLKNSSKQEKDDDILQLNYDSSLEILDASKKSTGLQNTARIAFAKYTGTADVMAGQDEVLKATAGIGVGATEPKVDDAAIWEPNAGDHAEYMVANNNLVKWSASDALKYAPKKLDNPKDGVTQGFDVDTQIPTYALSDKAAEKNIDDIYKWDGSESLVAKQNTLQTNKKSEDDYTVKEGVQDLVSTSDGTAKFGIAPNKICRIRVYLWLEGQDVDCINYASHGGGVKVNIGLVKGSTIGATN